MNDCVALYQKQLRKKLKCGSQVKEQMMGRFQLSVDTFLEENSSPTMEELHQAFGPPNEMAAILSEQISIEESRRYRRNEIIKKIMAIVLAALAMLFALYCFFWKNKPLTFDDDISVVDDVSVPLTSSKEN